MDALSKRGVLFNYSEAEAVLEVQAQANLAEKVPELARDPLAVQMGELKRLVEILRICIDRRFPPDSIIENALNQVESQCAVVVGNLKSKGEVNGRSKTRKTR